jgi:hypothetical protein
MHRTTRESANANATLSASKNARACLIVSLPVILVDVYDCRRVTRTPVCDPFSRPEWVIGRITERSAVSGCTPRVSLAAVTEPSAECVVQLTDRMRTKTQCFVHYSQANTAARGCPVVCRRTNTLDVTVSIDVCSLFADLLPLLHAQNGQQQTIRSGRSLRYRQAARLGQPQASSTTAPVRFLMNIT